MTDTTALALGAAIGGCTVAYLYAAVDFRARFPWSFTWSELLISYRGGFVRRGLVGELGYHLDPLIGVASSLSVAVFLGYLLVNTTAIWRVLRRSSFVGWLCVLSPGLVLFPLWDPRAFGRKDVVILGAFVLALAAIMRIRGAWSCFGVLVALYAVTGLVHETAWVYFVAAIGAMLLLRSDDAQTRIRVSLASLVCLAVWAFLVVAIKGSPDQAQAMMQAWIERYPNAYELPGAAEFLGQPISASLYMVGFHQRHFVTTAGYVLGFALTGAPVLLLARERWDSIVTRGRHWIVPGVLVAMLVPFVIANDWGRYSYLFWMHLLLFLGLLTPSARRSWGPQTKIAAGGALLVYALSWQVAHWAMGGTSPLRPGPLLWWM